MPREVFKDIKVSELPPELTEGLDAGPDELVRVTVDADYHRNVAELLRVAERASAEARRRGLTEEKLAELLRDD